MPTLTLSWTDLALVLLTAGVIGGAAIAGSHQIRPGSAPPSTGTKNKPRAAKKKKSQAKKNVPSAGPEPEPEPSPTPPEIPSPAQKPEETKKKNKPEPVRTAKTKSKKPARNELDDQEFPPLGASNPAECPKPGSAPERPESKPMRPLAERMQAPVRKTNVDDMIDEEVERPVQMARVMKIVDESSSSSSASESDAEDGWEKVSDGKKSRGGGKTMTLKMSSTAATSVTRPPGSANATAAASKRQRQNAKKKEAAKAAKAAEEAERLGRLTVHKRQQERVRMNEQATRSTSQTSKSKEVGGGMKASIAEDGRLIWE